MTAETKTALRAAYAEVLAHVEEGHHTASTCDWLRDKIAALDAQKETIDGIHELAPDKDATPHEKPHLGEPEDQLSLHKAALESRPDLKPAEEEKSESESQHEKETRLHRKHTRGEK